MSSRLPITTDEALEKEDRIDEISKQQQKHTPPIPHLLQTQKTPAQPYAKVVGRTGTGSYPAPSPDPATHTKKLWVLAILTLPSGIDQTACMCTVQADIRLHRANIYEPRHDKTSRMNVRTAKAQISLGIRPGN